MLFSICYLAIPRPLMLMAWFRLGSPMFAELGQPLPGFGNSASNHSSISGWLKRFQSGLNPTAVCGSTGGRTGRCLSDLADGARGADYYEAGQRVKDHKRRRSFKTNDGFNRDRLQQSVLQPRCGDENNAADNGHRCQHESTQPRLYLEIKGLRSVSKPARWWERVS